MVRIRADTSDQGWAWVILIAGFLNAFGCGGLALGAGVYVNAIIENWHVSRGAAALAGSIQLAIGHCAGVLSTFLITRVSRRSVILGAPILTAAGFVVSANVSNMTLLYIFYGAIPGLCAGVVYFQSMVMVNLYFNHYKSMAVGFALFGCGLASLLTPILERHLIDVFGWQPSFYIMAGIILQSCVFGMLMRPIRNYDTNFEIEQRPHLNETKQVTIVGSDCDKTGHKHNLRRQAIISFKETCPFEMWNNIRFILFVISNTLWSIGLGVLTVLAPNLYSEAQMDERQIDILLVLIGTGNASGRLIGGVIFNALNINCVLGHIIMTVIMGISICMHVVRSDFAMFAAAGLLYGLMVGGSSVTQSLVTREMTGIHYFASGYSAVLGFSALGIVIGPPLSGLLYDVAKSYQWAFLITGAMVIGAGLILIPILLFCKLDTDNRQETASESISAESGCLTNTLLKPPPVPNEKDNNTTDHRLNANTSHTDELPASDVENNSLL